MHLCTGRDIFSGVVSSSEDKHVVINSVRADKILIGVANKYEGNNVPELRVNIWGQVDKRGSFYQIYTLKGPSGDMVFTDKPVLPGMGFVGLIDLPGFVGIKVSASRSGAEDVPIEVAMRYLREAADSQDFILD
ncbi:hypothetical protein [Azonexus sp.]|uniref:hypothetical protein n=1 Tax=Azonexus sp. TaxID=1872668 RepID=UPI0035B4F21C